MSAFVLVSFWLCLWVCVCVCYIGLCWRHSSEWVYCSIWEAVCFSVSAPLSVCEHFFVCLTQYRCLTVCLIEWVSVAVPDCVYVSSLREYLAVFLCLCLYLCVGVCVTECDCLSVCVSVSLCLTVCISNCVSLCVSVSVSMCVWVCVSVCMCVCLCVCECAHCSPLGGWIHQL